MSACANCSQELSPHIRHVPVRFREFDDAHRPYCRWEATIPGTDETYMEREARRRERDEAVKKWRRRAGRT